MHSVAAEGLPAEAGSSTLKRAPRCEWRDLGRVDYAEAFEIQRGLVERRKRGEIADQFLIVEHPHTITLGRNGSLENLLAHEDVLARAGVAFHHTDRGGDITYHGPGQIVGYPIVDLRDWKRDVGAYVRAIEQVIIDALADLGIVGERVPLMTGVWVVGAKVAAIGVHISRWVTSHGFALNVTTDLSYFQYIVPCGLVKPVTSMAALGLAVERSNVVERLVENFARVFGRRMIAADAEGNSATGNEIPVSQWQAGGRSGNFEASPQIAASAPMTKNRRRTDL